MNETVAVLTDRFILGVEFLKNLKGVNSFPNRGEAITNSGTRYLIFIEPSQMKGMVLNRYVLVGNPSQELVDEAIINLC